MTAVEPTAYRVASMADVPVDRLGVSCVRCGAVYAVVANADRRSLILRAFDPDEAQNIMRADGHGVGGWCQPAFPWRPESHS